jgi:hypothetical protein
MTDENKETAPIVTSNNPEVIFNAYIHRLMGPNKVVTQGKLFPSLV